MGIKEKLMKNMGYFIVILDVALYFIFSYVFVKGFQENIVAAIINGALLFVGSMIATTAMMKQGLLNGEDTKKYQETLKSHLEQKQKIYTKLSKFQGWLDYDYAKLMKIGRSAYVNSAGYDYDEVFTENGKVKHKFKVDKPEAMKFKKNWWPPIKWLMKFCRWIWGDDWKVYRARKKFIRKAKHYKITRLTVSDLVNIEAERDPNNFGITERQYSRRETGSSAITRLMFSILLPSISLGFYGFNMAAFIQQLLSMILILMTALFSMFCAFSFKVKTHRMSIIKKINKMEEFENSNFEPEKEKPEKQESEETENKEEQVNEGICSEKSICTETSMVEEI